MLFIRMRQSLDYFNLSLGGLKNPQLITSVIGHHVLGPWRIHHHLDFNVLDRVDFASVPFGFRD